jgi:MFS family permease
MTNTPSPPAAAATALRWVLILTSTAYFMVILDTGALFAALPRMQRDLHADLASAQWAVNSYGIAFAAGILTAAALGDRFGRRRLFCGNLTMFLMSGATFAAAFLITQEFQIARGYSPVSTGLRLLPFFGTPMVVSPLAGALSDKIGRRPIMVSGLALQALGFAWVAARGSLHTSWIELVTALLVAGIGVSMALPTVPTAVLNSVAVTEMGKASGVNYMAQRFGAVFAIAIASAVFSAHGDLANPTAATAGFQAALWTCVGFAALVAATSAAITPRPSGTSTDTSAVDALAAA